MPGPMGSGGLVVDVESDLKTVATRAGARRPVGSYTQHGDGMKRSEGHRQAELPTSGEHLCLLAHGEQVTNTCRMAPPHHRHAQRTTVAPSVIHGPYTEREPRRAREA